MFKYFWYLLGYDVYTEDLPIMCINSFAPTNRDINYVMKRIYFIDDEDYDEEDTAPLLIKNRINKEELEAEYDRFIRDNYD